MIKHNLAQIIASDAHSSKFRFPVLSHSIRKVAELTSQEWAEAMVTNIPQAIIDGNVINDLPEPIKPKKSFLKRIFG